MSHSPLSSCSSRLPAVRRAGAAAALLLGLSLAAPAAADVVRLKTGEAIKGRPIPERSNEAMLLIEDYLTGILRQLAWDAVAPEDRERLYVKWGWDNQAAGLVKGVRLVQRLEGGDSSELFGVLEKQDEQAYHLRSDGQLLRVPRSQVAGEPEPVELDPRQVWTAEQLWDQFLAGLRKEGVDVDAPTTRDRWRMAAYADWIEYLEKAKEHYAACAADTEFLKSELAAQRLTRVDALLRAAAARSTLVEVKRMLSNNLFGRARAILEGFAERHPEAGEEVLKEQERLKAKFTEQRTKYFQQMALREFVEVVRDLIDAKVKEKEVTLSDLTSWSRRELPEKAFQQLADRMGRRDTVTPDEARTFWDGRPKRGWIRVSYGEGTFVVNPPKIKPPKPRRVTNPPKNAPKGPQVKFEIPKPPTRDQWWEKATARERANWVFAFFGETSELFEVGAREFKPCSLCMGTGLESKPTQTGEVVSWLCRRCAGSQNDVTAKFR